jgi:asparagine synthase (glutamine-hydrolysing)
MSALFGVVGDLSPHELDEMARRMAHRGAASLWREVHPGVFLGQLAPHDPALYTDSRLAMAVDAASNLIPNATDLVCEAFAQCPSALHLDRALRFPFTLAAWDAHAERLTLARDFLGLKPLHWCRLPRGGFAFATEYKALLAIHELPAHADLDAVRCLQMYKAMPAGRTMISGISPVPPGCVMRLRRDGTVEAIERMPDIPLDVRPMSEVQACEAVRTALERATVPLVAGRETIGLALSGGIDSMSTAFLAHRCAPSAQLVAFTAGESPDDPELLRAAKVMRHLNGEHRPLIVDNDELYARLPVAVWHLENPIGRSETFQYLALAKQAKEYGLDYLLTGMGADLLFGGMPRHKVLWLAELAPWLRKDLLQFFESTQTAEAASRPLARLMHAAYYRGRLPPPPRVLDCVRAYEPELVAEPGPEFLNRCLMLDGQEPTSRTLARIERPLQAYGLDYGSPFLDKAVIQLAFTIPGALKIRRGQQKYILRQAMQPWMSDELRRAPKELMRMRQGNAFAHTLQRLADRYLSPDRVRRRGFFVAEDIQVIRRACARKHHPEAAMRLWTAIVTEIWAAIYLDDRGRHPHLRTAKSGAQQTSAAIPGAVLTHS